MDTHSDNINSAGSNGMHTPDSKVPFGALDGKWNKHRFDVKLVNPSNKRKLDVIVVGTGLAGASAAASLAELGYNVHCFCFHDSPRRAHSVAAQGGINAAKNYRNDGDSIYRLFYDTIKGGDFRAREANVHRLAEISVNIIDQAVAQGVPLAREYGGMLDNRSFGGAQVSRTFYARGQTGQQLLYGAYRALNRQIALGKVNMYPRHEMLDLIVVGGKAQGIVTRNSISGEIKSWAAHAVVLATGGYGNVFYLSTNAKGSNVTAAWRSHKRGALFANPCFTQIHPTCIPASGDYQSKLTLMSESLRNDGRVWVPKAAGDKRNPSEIPDTERDYFLERKYPSFGNLVPRDIAARNIKEVCDEGKGVGLTGQAVYMDFADSISRLGEDAIRARYGNLFQMYEKIKDENPYKTPMQIYPAVHYTMGGLWVDYDLMSNIPGLFVTGEANFSDHGANRLGASALMQGLADGYFVLPVTIGNYLASLGFDKADATAPEFKQTEKEVIDGIDKMMSVNGTESPDKLHRKLGKVIWDAVGMSRSAEGLNKAIADIKEIKNDFETNVRILGDKHNLNEQLEKAGRLADFLELGELMAYDALQREESCGGHFRIEHQTPEGEALRDDENYSYVAAWKYEGAGNTETLYKEELNFEFVKPSQRSYK
ncbi:MAG: fumarate reductase/succinate dehydrogenase flavoprotein subunit [Bacteroidota bacterium]|nr:fumarate reductase/succinate dehydrogenase flavoprotein subunit [Bacteroidota bacterium]